VGAVLAVVVVVVVVGGGSTHDVVVAVVTAGRHQDYPIVSSPNVVLMGWD